MGILSRIADWLLGPLTPATLKPRPLDSGESDKFDQPPYTGARVTARTVPVMPSNVQPAPRQDDPSPAAMAVVLMHAQHSTPAPEAFTAPYCSPDSSSSSYDSGSSSSSCDGW